MVGSWFKNIELLVWTFTVINLLPVVAVIAENLKVFGVVVIDNPLVESQPRSVNFPLPTSVIIFVVDC
jgi:hypothetical protein